MGGHGRAESGADLRKRATRPPRLATPRAASASPRQIAATGAVGGLEVGKFQV